MIETELEIWEDDEDCFVMQDCSHISVQELYRPVLYDTIPDIPKIGTAGHTWWQEQIRRCVRGWIAPDGRYLSGYEYFYLNFVKVYVFSNRDKKYDWYSPLWRDNDHDIFNIIWSNRPGVNPDGTVFPGRNHVEGKARAVGWTLISLNGIKMYTFVFTPDLPVGSAYPDDTMMAKEKEWFIESWKLLHPMFKTHDGKKLDVLNSNENEFIVGVKVKGEKVPTIHNTAMFDVIASEKRAGIYKGGRMRAMFAVECGKWIKGSLKNFISENNAAIHNGDAHTGFFVIGGTANEIINTDGVYKSLFLKHKAWGATRHFTPKNKVLNGFWDEFTGKSDTAGARIKILSDRKLVEDDAALYHQEIIENPLTPQEAFYPKIKSAYNSSLINDQIEYIENNHIGHLWKRGSLEYILDVNRNKTGGVEFFENGEGEWLVNQEGLPNYNFDGLHISGIDDRYKSRDPNKEVKLEASRNAMVVYRQPTIYEMKSDMPVGIFLGEGADMNEAYEEFLKGMIFWDIRENMYEYNSDAFVNYLRDRGQLNRLYYIGDNYLPGAKLTPKLKTDLTSLGSQYFVDGRHKKNTSLEIMEAMRVWGTGTNTDIGSAFHLVLYLLYLTKEHSVTSAPPQSSTKTTYIKLGDPNYKPDAVQTSNRMFKLGQRRAS